MPSPRRWTQLLFLAFAISACQRAAAPVPEGDIAGSLTLPTLGDPLDTASLLGKPTLVVFVSASCPHCVDELPRAQAAARTGDANIVAVFLTARPEQAADVVQTAKFLGPVLLDDGTLRGKYGIPGVPYTLVLRPDGSANNALLGTQAPATLEGAIAEARRHG
jgi:thiol-disulfide isomerase/thioredoxin